MKGRLARLAGGLGVLVWALLGAAPAWAQTAEVGIKDYRYRPQELRVKTGTTVRWTNQERRVSHSILFLGKDGFESDRIFPGESWQRTFDTPGRYEYSCGPHPEMKGVVTVE
jgi:plastocyanin